MNESERVALAWVRRYLVGHHCDRCNKEWVTGASTSILVHHCTPSPQSVDWRTPRERRNDERAEWATEMFGALETALGDRARMEGEEDD